MSTRKTCGVPTATGAPCGRQAGWGTPRKTGPCRDHCGELVLAPYGGEDAESIEGHDLDTAGSTPAPATTLEDLREAHAAALREIDELEQQIAKREAEEARAALPDNTAWIEAIGERRSGYKHKFVGRNRLDFWGNGMKRVACWLNYGEFTPMFRMLIKRSLDRPGNRGGWTKWCKGWEVSLPDGWRNRPAVGPKGIQYVKFHKPARGWRVIIYIDQGLPEPLYRVLVAGTTDPEKENPNEGPQEVQERKAG